MKRVLLSFLIILAGAHGAAAQTGPAPEFGPGSDVRFWLNGGRTPSYGRVVEVTGAVLRMSSPDLTCGPNGCDSTWVTDLASISKLQIRSPRGLRSRLFIVSVSTGLGMLAGRLIDNNCPNDTGIGCSRALFGGGSVAVTTSLWFTRDRWIEVPLGR